LLKRFEKQLDLPALFVDRRNGASAKVKLIGEKDPSTTITINSAGCEAVTCAKYSLIRSVFILGQIIQSNSPSIGLTAP